MPPQTQDKFTGPASRIMQTPDGFQQCYNAQAALDAASLVIVGPEVMASPTDVQRLMPLLATLKEAAGRYPDQLSAYAGYASDGNLLGVR